jgi:hypothetical protein
MKAKLSASLMAVLFGFAFNGGFAQNADLQEPQTDQQETKTLPGADDATPEAGRANSTKESDAGAVKADDQMPEQSMSEVGRANEGDADKADGLAQPQN